MIWLNGWIKELILIILLASFTDLLLPNHALQRYVRTVIGLFLLLVLLSPVYELFNHRWVPDQWVKAVGVPSTGNTAMQPLSKILKDSNAIKAANQEQAKQLLESQIAVSMQEGIEGQTRADVKQLMVSIIMDESEKPRLDQVNMVLQESNIADPTPKPMVGSDPFKQPDIAVMKPISPVVIDLNSTEAEITKPLKANEEQQSTILQAEVKEYLAEQWQLKANQIHIK